MKYSILALIIGFVLDFFLGDPRWLYHPVQAIGALISSMEKCFRSIFPDTDKGEKEAGLCMAITVCVICLILPLFLLLALYHYKWWLGLIVESIFCYLFLAARSLKDESMLVYKCLRHGNLTQSRRAVGRIVGRDTDNLTEEGITKAAVETVAENLSDGVIAPMLYMAIGGLPMMMLYKAINTMDSMVGYKNEKYYSFGYYPAKLDDLANYIPARISAQIMILGSQILHMDWKNAKKIYRRDKYNHASPNSAHTEAVMAGALDIELAGDAVYFGKLYEKPTIGDDLRDIQVQDIKNANRLMYCTAGLALVFFAAFGEILELIFLHIF